MSIQTEYAAHETKSSALEIQVYRTLKSSFTVLLERIALNLLHCDFSPFFTQPLLSYF